MNKIPKDMISGTVHESLNYGPLVIVYYKSQYNVKIRFENTGTECVTSSLVIRRGLSKDRFSPSVYGVGYIGGSDSADRDTCKSSKSYKAWQRMLERCYSDKYQERRPTYKGCTVDPIWHNFQVFNKWFNDNYIEGYQLDKDIKVKGNKVYSPETCLYVSCAENNCYNVKRLHN